MARKMILQFERKEGHQHKWTPESVHIPIGYAWQEGPDDLHVQFDGPAADNFYPMYKRGCYFIKYKGCVLKYIHMSFKMKPNVGSKLLDKLEMESFWISPNRPKQR